MNFRSPPESYQRLNLCRLRLSKSAVLMALHSFKLPEGSAIECRQSPLLGFHSLFAISAMRVHFSWSFPRDQYVPSSGFLSLLTVCSSQRLAALFRAATAYRVLLFRALPSQAATVVVRIRFSLLTLASSYRRCASKLKQLWTVNARLQGFDPLWESVSPAQRLNITGARYPLELSSSPRCSLLLLWLVVTEPPLMTFACRLR